MIPGERTFTPNRLVLLLVEPTTLLERMSWIGRARRGSTLVEGRGRGGGAFLHYPGAGGSVAWPPEAMGGMLSQEVNVSCTFVSYPFV